MTKLNQIIIKQSVLFYSKAWNHRNEILHTPEKYREYVVEWNERIIQKIELGKKPEMIKYLRAYPLDISRCTNSYIRRWNLAAHEFYKKAKDEVVSDIRNYFNRQIRNE